MKCEMLGILGANSVGYRVYDSRALCPSILANGGGLGILTIVRVL